MAGEFTVVFNHIPELIDALINHAGEGLEEGAKALLEDAQANAPVVTGGLRDSGYVIAGGTDTYDDAVGNAASDNPGMGFTDKPDPGPDGAIVGFAADYAIYVEEGTMYMAGNPFLLSAAYRNSSAFSDGMKKFVELKAAE